MIARSVEKLASKTDATSRAATAVIRTKLSDAGRSDGFDLKNAISVIVLTVAA